MNIKGTIEILNEIKELVKTKGYIYVLCLIIIDDFHLSIEKLHETDFRSRLNKNELSLLIGFLIQYDIKLEIPDSPEVLIELKKKTYKIMEELHHSTMTPMVKKIKPLIEKQDENLFMNKRDFFGGEDVFIEPIFYAGDGIYDFQYLEFLEKKYKYDEEWLKEKANFEFDKAITITTQIKSLHQEKIQKINFLEIRENKNQIIADLKRNKSIPKRNLNKNIEEYLTSLEFYQFFELFETEKHLAKGLSRKEITLEGWKSFYKGLIELFTICKSDFDANLNIESFLNNFSVPTKTKDRNVQFQNIGDFNIFSAKPIIPIDSNNFFVPILYSVYEAVYESPFYWMQADKLYTNKLAENRGKVGEEMTYEILKKVFGEERTYKSIKIESKKGYDLTDIDVLCILGSKALCVQVKSKKLTQLSRKGNYSQLLADFKGAVQDAYKQGLICRKSIVEKNAVFYNTDGNKIKIAEDIDEVYILGVTSENYPTLTHQAYSLLEKDDNSPSPLILTIFDLELLAFYLKDPYDFLYYVRQRVELMEYFYANEEMYFLGYHLINKLWKNPKYDIIQIDSDFGQLIDRNYYPYKLGIETSSESDRIRNRWKNVDFETLCKQIDELRTPKATDVIFQLLDWSQDSRDNLIHQIKLAKSKTNSDGDWHNFTLMAGPLRSSFGVTFVSWRNNNIHELANRLQLLCSCRKYKSKANIWIGIGCLSNSERMVDVFVFSDKEWQFDETLEKETKFLFDGENQGKQIKLGRKIGRNEYCSCGSGLKFKKCCGRNN